IRIMTPQKGLDFRQLTVDLGRRARWYPPIWERTWVRTVMVFNCSATFSVICQTRTYCQLAPAATGFPLLSTKSEYPATGALGSKPPPGVSPVPAPVTTEGKTVVSVLPSGYWRARS